MAIFFLCTLYISNNFIVKLYFYIDSCNIINNKFGSRDEYHGGPDGYSIDFETHIVALSVINNYIFIIHMVLVL